jgi:hypothetical protein
MKIQFYLKSNFHQHFATSSYLLPQEHFFAKELLVFQVLVRSLSPRLELEVRGGIDSDRIRSESCFITSITLAMWTVTVYESVRLCHD